MAKLPALVTAAAEVDRHDRATVDHYARVIREAGYIPTTKRGSGAAEMTAREAANLLIALCGADAPKDAPLAIDRFRSLANNSPPGVPGGGLLEMAKPVFEAVVESATFGEALERLIEGVPELVATVASYVLLASHDRSDKARRILLRQALQPGGGPAAAGLRIVFHRPPAVEIDLWAPDGPKWQARFLADVGRLEAGFYGSREHDQEVSVAVGLPTLIALSRGIDPEADVEAAAEALGQEAKGEAGESKEGAS